MKQTLQNDIARCDGDKENWRAGCESCLRRTSPRPEMCWMMLPPAIVAFECEYFIETIKVPRPKGAGI